MKHSHHRSRKRSDSPRESRRHRKEYRSRSRDRHRKDERSREHKRKDAYEFSDSDIKSKENKYTIKEEKKEEVVIEKEKPCFEPSGILAEFSNSVNGVVIKFTEPLDSAIPD